MKRSYGTQVHLATRKRIPNRDLVRVAVRADCDVRTVRKILCGEPVLIGTARRVFQVLFDEGLISEGDLGPDVVAE
jgi:hypothetical protein